MSMDKQKQQEEQQQPPKEATKDNKMNQVQEGKLFLENEAALAELLVNSVGKLADLAAQNELITDNVRQQAADEIAKTYNQMDRASELVAIIIKKMGNAAWNNAEGTMDKFLESIEDLPDIQKYLSDERRTWPKSKHPEREILSRHRVDIADSLQTNVIQVAGKLLAVGVINSAEHHFLTDPQAKQNNAAVLLVLRAIGITIKRDKTTMKVFLDNVLDEMGGPVSEVAKDLRKKLQAGEDTDGPQDDADDEPVPNIN